MYIYLDKRFHLKKKKNITFTFNRRFYPKRLTLHSSYSFNI